MPTGHPVFAGGGGAPSETGKAIFASGQWGYWSAHAGSSTGIQETGTFNSLVGDSSSSLEISDDGVALRQNTSGALNNDVFIITNPTPIYRTSMAPLLVTKFALPDVADIRFYSGLKSGAFLAADLITDASVGVQFSTGRGDTNWQFLKHDGTTQVIVDSGLAPDTSVHHVVVDAASPTSIIVKIMDATFTEQASTTFTTGLPASTKNLQNAIGNRALAAAVKSVDDFFSVLVQRSP